MTSLRFLPLFLALLGLLTAPVANSKAASGPEPERVAEAVKKLQDIGVITDGSYWLDNAQKGKSCDGPAVAELMIAAAKKFGPADNVSDAIKILMDNKVIQNKKSGDFWNKAVTTSHCSGNFVGGLIVQMAEVL